MTTEMDATPPKKAPTPHPDIPGAFLLPLTQGFFAIIDEADVILVSSRLWSTRRGNSTSYAQAANRSADGKWRPIKLHRFLWAAWGMGPAKEIDHKNRNGLDCRRSNLRAATRSQNEANKTGLAGRVLPKGVRRNRRKWEARLKKNGKQIYLGNFSTIEEAAQAYARGAAEHFGEFARTS